MKLLSKCPSNKVLFEHFRFHFKEEENKFLINQQPYIVYKESIFFCYLEYECMYLSTVTTIIISEMMPETKSHLGTIGSILQFSMFLWPLTKKNKNNHHFPFRKENLYIVKCNLVTKIDHKYWQCGENDVN